MDAIDLGILMIIILVLVGSFVLIFGKKMAENYNKKHGLS
jgi:uncharacterized protein YpmB